MPGGPRGGGRRRSGHGERRRVAPRSRSTTSKDESIWRRRTRCWTSCGPSSASAMPRRSRAAGPDGPRRPPGGADGRSRAPGLSTPGGYPESRCPPHACASRPRPPATCTSAAPARPCSTGSFARQQGGEFLLRIEDTDTERNQPELIDDILRARSSGSGLDWDGEPVHQSERRDLYREAAEQLRRRAGRAYWCDCTRERSRAPGANAAPPGYDGHCRDRDARPRAAARRAALPRARRGRRPSFDDLIRGDGQLRATPTSRTSCSCGPTASPMFLLANAVDDADMGITHVLRGEEPVNVTPKYLLLRRGARRRPSGRCSPTCRSSSTSSARSCRSGATPWRSRTTASDGYLPEAMVNYLALLGWGPPDGVEIRPLDEIVELFRLEDVNAVAGVLRREEARRTSTASTSGRCRPTSSSTGSSRSWPDGERDRAVLEPLAAAVQERVRHAREVERMVDFLWLDEPVIDEAAWEKAMVEGRARRRPMLDGAVGRAGRPCVGAEPCGGGRRCRDARRSWLSADGLKLGKAQAPVRVAVTGRDGRAAAVRVARGRSGASERSAGLRAARAPRSSTRDRRLRCARRLVRLRSWSPSPSARGLPGRHLRPGVAGVDAATRPGRPTPSSCSAPPSTTASRRRCWPAGSTTPPSSTSDGRRAARRRHRRHGSPATASPRPTAAAAYLERPRACPTSDIVREMQGAQLAGSRWRRPPAFLARPRASTRVVLVSDPYHATAHRRHRRRARPRRRRVAAPDGPSAAAELRSWRGDGGRRPSAGSSATTASCGSTSRSSSASTTASEAASRLSCSVRPSGVV